jgi:hypothetical protein
MEVFARAPVSRKGHTTRARTIMRTHNSAPRLLGIGGAAHSLDYTGVTLLLKG